MDDTQTVFEVLGNVPVAGEFFDGANGLISLGRGDKINAAANFSAMVPIFGTGLKYGMKGIGKGLGTTYEIADGVRRAKAAQELGHTTIKAVDNAGNIFQVPIKNLTSPMKNSIDISTPLNQLRYDRIYNGIKPIYVNPGNRGISIFDVIFKK